MLCDVLSCDVLLCDVILCDVLLCGALLCDVLSCDVLSCHVMYCYVMYCCVMYCYAMYCYVMHRCVMSCYVMYLCTVVWCTVMWFIVVWCTVLWCIVMWCIVTALRFIRNSENRYPTLLTTSFDNYGPLITGTALPRRTKRSEKDSSCIPIPIPWKNTYHRGDRKLQDIQDYMAFQSDSESAVTGPSRSGRSGPATPGSSRRRDGSFEWWKIGILAGENGWFHGDIIGFMVT